MGVKNTTSRNYPFPTADTDLQQSNDILWNAFNDIDNDINNLFLEKADLNDDENTKTNTWSAYKLNNLFQPSSLLDKIKTVDGKDSGLDADLIRNRNINGISSDINGSFELDLNANTFFVLNATDDTNITFTTPNEPIKFLVIIKPNSKNITLPDITWLNNQPDFTKSKVVMDLIYDGEEFLGLSY